ncbi:MAG: PAS-domain containing protein, partial [Rudaea sp.]
MGFAGLSGLAPIARAVVASLVTNLGIIALFALFVRKRASAASAAAVAHELERGELRALAGRFLPLERVAVLLGDGGEHETAGTSVLATIEHDLSAVIGTASARLLLDVARRERSGQLDTLAAIVDEASADLRFNQRILLAALENMSQGICVVDADLCVVAWNRRYAELFAYPAGLLSVGRPVEELTRWAIDRGMIGAGLAGLDSTAARVQRRLAHMRAGTPLISERRFPDGSEIEIRGNPMPGGGFVATFTDVTAFRHAAQALTRANETLEQRVAERTGELEQATRAAERASATKTRFLAAVSHDLMQPLHAAQLFAHTLSARVDDSGHDTARHLQGALEATEALLGGLLDIARLDGGTLVPRPRDFALHDLLAALAAEFGALAAQHGLRLDYVRTRHWVRSDPHLLRRVLQNFLSNALRHVERGQILLGCRREGESLRIEIWDSGPGIAPHEQRLIFEEFRRGSRASGQGLGLGLAIADRMARLLDHHLGLRSWPGRGSVFSVSVPRVAAPATPPVRVRPAIEITGGGNAGVALVVDNEAQALTAMKTLLVDWGWTVLASGNAEGALALARDERPDIAILDYHLGGGEDGLTLYTRLQEMLGELPAVIVTADRDSGLRKRARDLDVVVLYKPLKPLALAQVLRQRAAAVVEK